MLLRIFKQLGKKRNVVSVNCTKTFDVVVCCFQRRSRIAFSDELHIREELLGGDEAHSSEDQVSVYLRQMIMPHSANWSAG